MVCFVSWSSVLSSLVSACSWPSQRSPIRLQSGKPTQDASSDDFAIRLFSNLFCRARSGWEGRRGRHRNGAESGQILDLGTRSGIFLTSREQWRFRSSAFTLWTGAAGAVTREDAPKKKKKVEVVPWIVTGLISGVKPPPKWLSMMTRYPSAPVVGSLNMNRRCQ